MKYYHIIYNSSERPMDGGVGFGIRTATEGTPAGLLNAIKNIKFFTDDWESYVKKPTPAQIKDNPSTMEEIARNYAVTHVVDEKGKAYYIIARRAYVGFDYGFYKNGMPTRPGNYVIDYYAFESVPDCAAYEILYEKALAGSNHFIPASVQPTIDNDEMKSISVGAPQPLPVEEKPFKADVEDALDKSVVKLFFTYLRSKKNGHKLVVRVGKDRAAKLVADFYRMLSPELAKEIRTYVNLRSQGTNDNFDIFFIHEDYPHQIYEGLYDYMDLDSASMPDTDEAKTFAKDLETFVSTDFAINKADIDDKLKWLMFPEYDTVKKLSKQTNEAFFTYCIQTDNFVYDTMKINGSLNDELLRVLAPYTKKSPQNAERFNLVVTEAMNDVTPDSVVALIQEYNALQKIGFALDTVTEKVKMNVCSQLLDSAKVLKKALDIISFAGVEKFFCKSVFEDHKDYVDSDILDSYMCRLYKLFLPQEELAKRAKMLYSHFFKREMDAKLFCQIIDDVYGNDDKTKLQFFTQILQKDYKPFKTIWPYMQVYLDKSGQSPDFFHDFSDRLSNAEYAPMFYYALKANKGKLNSVEEIKKLTTLLSNNGALKSLVERSYATDGLYTEFYKLAERISAPAEALKVINENVLQFLHVKDEKFEGLALYLRMVIEGKPIANIPLKELAAVYKIVVSKRNLALYRQLFGNFKKLLNSDVKSVTPLEFVRDYGKFYRDKSCVEMYRDIVSSPNQIDVIGAIIKDYGENNFKEALEIVDQLNMADSVVDKFMRTYYSREYASYLNKSKIMNVFSSIKDGIQNLFSKK